MVPCDGLLPHSDTGWTVTLWRQWRWAEQEDLPCLTFFLLPELFVSFSSFFNLAVFPAGLAVDYVNHGNPDLQGISLSQKSVPTHKAWIGLFFFFPPYRSVSSWWHYLLFLIRAKAMPSSSQWQPPPPTPLSSRYTLLLILNFFNVF